MFVRKPDDMSQTCLIYDGLYGTKVQLGSDPEMTKMSTQLPNLIIT